MTRTRPFQQVDVFTSRPYFGNPLAVVLDGSGLSDEEMQQFARWTQLSETTFLLPPSAEAAAAGADYQVRIFTTQYEMPFAGHPTLGSCHAWLSHGGVAKNADYIVQQCKVGLVRIRRTGDRLAFAAPPLTRNALAPQLQRDLLQTMGLHADQLIDAQHLRNGPHHIGLLLDSRDTLGALNPDRNALAGLMRAGEFTGIGLAALSEVVETPALIVRSNREARAFGGAAGRRTAATDSPAAIASAQPDTGTHNAPDMEVRFFHLGASVVEDPVTGSFNASLAQWLIAQGHAPGQYVAAQGLRMACDGRVFVDQDASGQVWVGGHVVQCVAGEVRL